MTTWTPDRIRALRERLDMGQEEFATTLGYGAAPRVSELETGARTPSGPVSRLLDYVDRYGPISGEG